ncbi:MAG: hypothetical protein Q8M98_10305 [Candidatus Cloacimonadaceae bacterium]|nr:hypothetical protein [Candidatus Cloacimonadaceae bacterium]
MIKIKLILAIASMMIVGVVHALFSGGSGTSVDPYQIANANDLNNVRGSYLNKYFIQTADIDLSSYGIDYDGGKGWVPIGTESDPFRGV